MCHASNIFIASETVEEHLAKPRENFEYVRNAGFRFKAAEYALPRTEAELMECIMTIMTAEKLNPLKDAVKIQDSAANVHPMVILRRKDVNFQWY